MGKRHPKIGIDGRCLVGNRTGVGRYLIEICQYLDKLLPNHKFYIYSNNEFSLPIKSPRWQSRIDENPLWKHSKKIPWLKFRLGKLCQEDGIDIFWGPMHFLPNLDSEIKTVLTIHDFFYLYSSPIMSMYHRIAHRYWQSRDLRRANHVVVNSITTGKKLEEFFGFQAYSIAAPGLSTIFRRSTTKEIEQLRERHNLYNPFFLSVATWNPRKNLEAAIMAFLEIKKTDRYRNHELVLVGDKGWKHHRLNVYTKPPYSEWIRPLGYLDDQELPSLYTATEAFLFPSLYEGFGIPVMEARACGAPIIATDIPELREAGGNDGIYVSPDVAGILRGIRQLESAPKTMAPVIDPLYSWEQSARTMADIFEKLLDK